MGFKKILKDFVGKVESALGTNEKQITDELPDMLDKSWSGRATEGPRHYQPWDASHQTGLSREGSSHFRRGEASVGRHREGSVGHNRAYNPTMSYITAAPTSQPGTAEGPAASLPLQQGMPRPASTKSLRSANRSAPARNYSKRTYSAPPANDSAIGVVEKVTEWLQSNSSSDPDHPPQEGSMPDNDQGPNDSASSVHDSKSSRIPSYSEIDESARLQQQIRTHQSMPLPRDQGPLRSADPSGSGRPGMERVSLLSLQIRDSNNPSAAQSREGSARPVRLSNSTLGEYSSRNRGWQYLGTLTAGIPEVDKLVQVLLTEEGNGPSHLPPTISTQLASAPGAGQSSWSKSRKHRHHHHNGSAGDYYHNSHSDGASKSKHQAKEERRNAPVDPEKVAAALHAVTLFERRSDPAPVASSRLVSSPQILGATSAGGTRGGNELSRSDWDKTFIKRWKAVKKRARLQALGLRSIWKVSSPDGPHHMPELLTSELPLGNDNGTLSSRRIGIPGAGASSASYEGGGMNRDPSLAIMLLGEVAEVC